MGYTVLPPYLAPGMPGQGFSAAGADRVWRQLEQYKTAWARRLQRLQHDTPICFPGWQDWDAEGRALSAGAATQ